MCRCPGPTLSRVLIAIEGQCLRLRIISPREGPHEGDKFIRNHRPRTGRLSLAEEFDCGRDLPLSSSPTFDLPLAFVCHMPCPKIFFRPSHDLPNGNFWEDFASNILAK